MTMITTSSQLSSFCEPLLSSSVPLAIGIDTEFAREKTFWPKLCLIQIISPLQSPLVARIIDPLSDLDLTPFKELLTAPHLTKVIHSARQDLEIFWHKWQTLPQSFFDTQVAAMVCGFGSDIGYGTMVKSLFHLELEKESQYTDWSRRPLTQKQLDYALADVTHLLPAFEFLSQQLTQLNRWEWMKDDIDVLLNPSTYTVDPQHAWLRVHTHRHKPKSLAILQDLCAWREIHATELNVNRGRLLRDECILKIGLTLPQTIEDLVLLADSSILTESLAQSLFSIYQTALQKPQSLWPEAPKKQVLSILTRRRLEHLRDKLLEVTTALNVPARLIAPKKDLIALAEGQREGNRILTGWRYEVFGRLIEDLLDT